MDPETPPAVKKRRKGALPWWVSLLTLSGVLAGFAGLIYYGYQPKNGVQFTEFEAEARSTLQVGTTTREDAQNWFSARGISQITDVLDAGGKKDGYLATLPNDSWLDKGQIEVITRFDREGKLKELAVYRARVE